MYKTTLVLSATLFAVTSARDIRAADISFSRDVRPILAANCMTCHGPDATKREGKLRLDDRSVATAPAKGGLVAIVPDKPNESELIKRITSGDPDIHMPPTKSKRKPLSDAEISILRQWIAQGAKYESHWAFSPPIRPAVPQIKEPWAANPIDAFILDRLQREGMKPAPETDKITLLRRLSLDLIGLPPTIAEVDAFLADQSPNAYETQVERLLASPHYGERWGRHWLDAARYADSDGFEKDKLRFVWFYRDWVINAFNRDLPYDKFIIEQIAGDQLPHATQDQIIAAGFLRNSMLNEEGGVDPEQFRMDAMFDRMDAIGKSILGLTIQCGQCHSHKYDPISQADYYSMFAFLNNDNEACRVVYTPEQLRKIAEIKNAIQGDNTLRMHKTPGWEARLAAWENAVRNDQPSWTVLDLEHIGEKSQRYIRQADGSLLAQGYAPTKFSQLFEAKSDLRKISALRLELLNDPNLPCGGPGRSIKGTCALSEFSVEVAPASDPKKKVKVKISDASSDYDQPVRDLEPMYADKTTVKRITGPVKFAIDGDATTAWGIDAGPGRRNQPRKAVFNLEKPIDIEGGVILSITLKQNHGGWNSDDNQNNNLGRFRISVTDSAGNVKADPLPMRVRRIISIPYAKRTRAEQTEVFNYWRTTVPQWKSANEYVESQWQQYPEGVTQLTFVSRAKPRETHMLNRGDWLKPTQPVTAAVPAFLNPLPANAPPTRLTFANWLVDRKAPTTARVFVNRIWQEYFGIGLVATPEDFGTKGEHPSHPELLDWLACEFMEPGAGSGPPGESADARLAPAATPGQRAEPGVAAGAKPRCVTPAPPWSIKHIHRLIVNSSTYRQSSRVNEEMLARDPYNRLLAHAPRHRVEGEIIHDIALSASGLLNDAIGGRPMMPPAPAFLFLPPASYGPFPWIDETGSNKYRRAVYTFRRRSTPFPMLQTFDVPNGDASCVRRARTNSPMQALVSLNEPMFVEAAQALARKTLEEGGKTDSDRLNYAFRRVLSRTPNAAERSELLSLFEKERARFSEGWVNPNEIATGKTTPPSDLPAGATPTQLAAWTVVSRVLLNLDEAITKE